MTLPKLVSIVSVALIATTITAHSQEFGRNSDQWEARLGVAAFDVGPFTRQHLSGVVINGEFLAPSPHFLAGIGSPRPYVGFDAVISDQPIHVFYAGLNWEAYFTEKLYAGVSVGGSINTDDRVGTDSGHVKNLGSQVLFHLQASIGYDLSEQFTAQVYLNHFSNAQLANANHGLESVGIRFGVRF